MSIKSIRIPIPPTILITFVLSTLLLYATSLVAPSLVQGPVLLLAALMMIVITFSSIELALYFLILATLLSPEITLGGAPTHGDLITGKVNTTESRGITIRLDDIMLTLITITWMFRIAIRNELGILKRTPINQAAGLYWFAAAFSTILAYFQGDVGVYGLFFIVKYLEYFVLFYMVINHIHDEAIIKRLLFVMIFTCMVASLVSMLQIPQGLRVSAPFEGEQGEPNTFGGYLMFMFSVLLGILLHTTSPKQRLMLFVMLGIIFIPFIFTESRSSYIAFAASILLFLLFSPRKKLLLFMCFSSIVIAPFIIPQNVMNRILFTFNQAEQEGQLVVGELKIDTSTTERLKSWEKVLTKSFPENPFLGVGVTGGQFLDAQYPRVLLETGMVGLILFIWFLRRIWVLLKSHSKKIRDPMMRGVALGTLCGYGGLLVHAIGANTFIIVRIMEPFMITLGLILAMRMLEKEQEHAGKRLQ